MTLVGHLNNAYISREKIPTRFYILEKIKQQLATINRGWESMAYATAKRTRKRQKEDDEIHV